MIVIIYYIIAFLAGTLAGAALLWHSLPARLRQRVDYKERWQAAVSLLAEGGQLTDEQLKLITGPAPAAVPEDTVAGVPVSELPAPSPVLRSMASWDRKAIEVKRAQGGLPPADDLVGMASWDKRAVLEARARYGTG